MTDLRDAADRVMRTNFPESSYLKPDSRRKNAPWWRIWDPDW
jgi:outer membrane protein assembly factor BamD